MERRFTPSATANIEEREDGKRALSGVAAVFYRKGDADTEYQLARNVFERIDRAAFDEALGRGDDTRALFNHDPNHLLGRTAAGTLRLEVSDDGLRYDIDLPSTSTGSDVAESVKRGDLTGSSFAFTVERADWIEEDGRDVRVIKSVRLFDVGPVTYPAYEGTSTALRSDGDASEAMASLEEHRRIASRSRMAKVSRARALEIS